MNNTVRLLEEAFYRFSLLPAINDCDSNEYTNYLQLSADVDAMHGALVKLGIQKGDRVILCGKNSTEWICSYIALLLHGAIAIPIPETAGKSAITAIAGISHAKAIIAEKQFMQAAGDLNLPFMELGNWKHSCLKGYNMNKTRYDSPDDDEAAICIYKENAGAWEETILTHGTLAKCLDHGIRSSFCKEGTVVLATRPLAHTFGCICDVLLPLVTGGQLYILNNGSNFQAVTDRISAIKPEFLCTNPQFMESLVRTRIETRLSKSPIRFISKIPGADKLLFAGMRRRIISILGNRIRHIYMGGDTLEGDVEEILCKCKIDFTVNYGITIDGLQSYRK